MNRTYEIIRGTVILVVFVALAIWVMSRWLKRSKDDPGALITKWIATALVLFAYYATAGEGLPGLMVAVLCGGVLAVMWTGNICNFFAKPLGDLFDGSGEVADPGPFYSIALARQKQSQFTEAVAEVRRQLEKYPHDYEGQMLLATLQAENLNDLQAAQTTIDRLINQPGRAPANVSFALNSLADWHLKYGLDPDSARLALERVVQMFPDTDVSQVARQRLAHLGSSQVLAKMQDKQPITLPSASKDLGLHLEESPAPLAEEDPTVTAANFVKHLEQHPLDNHAREQLARLYADHYHRIDLATGELEQLIAHPHQSNKDVARWLTMLAEMQFEITGDRAGAHATLQRVIDLFPNSGLADYALQHQTGIDLDAAPPHKRKTLKLGSYEKDLGLKSGR